MTDNRKMSKCIHIETEFDFEAQGTQMQAEFAELQNMAELAIVEIMLKLNTISDELQAQTKRNPVHLVESRVKTLSSILCKLNRKGSLQNVQAAREELTDIAGVRIICDYIDDIYLVEDLLCSQSDISLIKKTDYIKNPKANGYRSLHLVVRVPVTICNVKEYVPVEIQIRSIAMDFWASLEHQIYYKRGCENVPNVIVERLKVCSDSIAKIDIEMQNINKELQIRCNAE